MRILSTSESCGNGKVWGAEDVGKKPCEGAWVETCDGGGIDASRAGSGADEIGAGGSLGLDDRCCC